MKKNKKLLISLASITSTIVTTIPIVTIGMNNNSSNINLNEFNSDVNQNTNNNINNLNNLQNANQQLVKPLIKTENNYFNPRLSTKNGPITFWGDTITSVDWFGGSRWEKDVKTIEIEGRKPFINSSGSTSWKRYWLNFDLDKKMISYMY